MTARAQKCYLPMNCTSAGNDTLNIMAIQGEVFSISGNFLDPMETYAPDVLRSFPTEY